MATNVVTLQIDPLGKFSSVPPQRLLEATGLLPMFLMQGLDKGEDAQTALTSRYQFYMGPLEGGRILPNGSFQYPGDPVLHPIVSCHLPDESIYFYQHAIVGVVKTTGEQWLARMD